jgi:ABC-type transport system substrate-binding protein
MESLKKAAPAAEMESSGLNVYGRYVPRDAHGHQAVRRHPRAPRAQHGGQQGGDHQGVLQRPRRDCWPIRSIPRSPATSRAAQGACPSQRQGAVQVYDPAKAKKLLAEAGYPNGFTFKVQVCSCNNENMDLLPLISAYLEQVGVKIEIQPMEYAAFLSVMSNKTHTAGYYMNIRQHQSR